MSSELSVCFRAFEPVLFFFKIFRRRSTNHDGRHFYSAPTSLESFLRSFNNLITFPICSSEGYNCILKNLDASTWLLARFYSNIFSNLSLLTIYSNKIGCRLKLVTLVSLFLGLTFTNTKMSNNDKLLSLGTSFPILPTSPFLREKSKLPSFWENKQTSNPIYFLKWGRSGYV